MYRLATIWEDGSRTTLIVRKITIQERINSNGKSVKMAWVQEYPGKNILYIHLFEIHSITALTEKEKRKYRLMDAHRRVKNIPKRDKIEGARQGVKLLMQHIIRVEESADCSDFNGDLIFLQQMFARWLQDHKILSDNGDNDKKTQEIVTPLQPAVETKSGANSKTPKEKQPKRTRENFLPTDAFFRRVSRVAQALYSKN